MHAIEVFDPSGSTEVLSLHAPRLDTLDGKTVALLSNDMWQAHRMLPRVREQLQVQFPDATFISETEFPMGTWQIDTEETVDMLVARGVNAVIVGNAACGACATACGRVAARIESRGIPTVILTREEFVGVVRNAIAGLGFDQDASMVVFPIDPFLVGSDLSPIERDIDKFRDGLTEWRAAATETGERQPSKMRIEANGYEAALDKMNRLFLTSTWGDGLPLNAPTDERVDWILKGTKLSRDTVIGKVMPRGGVATVETLAVSLAMAGGRPEYLPVLIAATAALLDPDLEHDKMQATSGSTFPVVIVNGPMAEDIRLNSGFGLLGPDPRHPAGASIGRALRLVQQNVGGALPGVGTMAIFGAMRYTNVVIAEDEAGLPPDWDPVSVDFGGAKRGENAVTLYVATGASNVMRRGIGKETPEDEAIQSLHRVAAYLRSPSCHYVHGHWKGTPGALLMPRVVAKQLSDLGWTKEKIKTFLWENSRIPHDEVMRTGLWQWIDDAADPNTKATADDDLWAICRDPSQIILAVAGGEHPTHNFWMQANSSKVANAPIDLPAGWDGLIAEAEEDWGPSGEICLI